MRVVSRDIAGKLLFLGTGTSYGVPVVGCGCAVCSSHNPRNQRTRCSVILGLPEGNLLIDTPPELRIQFLREGVGICHAVLITHTHADHIFGLDDCRIFSDRLKHDLPVFCDAHSERRIRQSFDYAFDPQVRNQPGGGVPRLVLRSVGEEPFPVLGALVTPIPLLHGRARILGYRIGNVAYCTDTQEIPPQSMQRLQGLDVLILDCLRHRPHGTHFNMEQALAVVRQLQPRRTLFTHMAHDLDHEATNADLPPQVELAYDGMVIPLTPHEHGS